MKMVGLHTLSHEEDKDQVSHCVICDYAIAQKLTPCFHQVSDVFTVENNVPVVKKERFKHYSCVLLHNIAVNLLFCRPPPFFL
ncbi:hypothetical protein DU428_12070 [Oceanihabitans sediminis]|uniref:Uncharacterized protein n=2 Tax=Oceanihabitans sediminis TaxID=1812012 RepID=A0A368P1A7_9FLAO|nr:hypothetical protein DU428_12070 [Oceanihabitans sediminis]